jgi:hypothetical protein
MTTDRVKRLHEYPNGDRDECPLPGRPPPNAIDTTSFSQKLLAGCHVSAATLRELNPQFLNPETVSTIAVRCLEVNGEVDSAMGQTNSRHANTMDS